MTRKNAEYLYNVYEDHVELVKYIGLKKTVEIPAELDNLPVTHIGLDCFAHGLARQVSPASQCRTP
jgi:hypothetical protein